LAGVLRRNQIPDQALQQFVIQQCQGSLIGTAGKEYVGQVALSEPARFIRSGDAGAPGQLLHFVTPIGYPLFSAARQ